MSAFGGFQIKRRYVDFFVLVLFAILASIVPWPEIFKSIYGYPMVDREVYAEYFLYGESVLHVKEFAGFLSYFTNEFLWHFGVSYFLNVGFGLDHIFYGITFLVFLSFGGVVLKRGEPWALLLLINPLVVDFAFSQLRLAFGVSILIWAYLLAERHKLASAVLCLMALFVHSAVVIFLFIYVIVVALDGFSRRYDVRPLAEWLILFLVGAAISLAIGPLRESILTAIGDRRAEYSDMASSLQYSLFWVLLLALSLVFAARFVQDYVGKYAIVILSIVAVNVTHGGYSTRFLAAAFPFLVSSVLSFRGNERIVLIGFFVYGTLQWIYWLGIV